MNNFPCCENCSSESASLHSPEEHSQAGRVDACAVRAGIRQEQTYLQRGSHKVLGDSGEGDVRLRPGRWEASKQGGDSAGHEIRQEFGLGRVEPAEGATSAQAWPTGGSAGRCVYGVHYMNQQLERERAQRDVFFLNYKGP